MMKPLTTITTRRVARFCGDNIELLGLATLALILVTVPEAAYAAGGVNRVNAFMDNIGSMLRAASVSVVTVALMWSGYKIAWTPAGVQDVAKPFMGALLIGAAAEIARFLLV